MTRPFPDHYVLDEAGEPLAIDDVLAWAQWFQTADRRVAFDTVGHVEVSTVFLGLNHNFSGTGPPVLWETMVFGEPMDCEMERYTSRDDALAGHAAMLERVINLHARKGS